VSYLIKENKMNFKETMINEENLETMLNKLGFLLKKHDWTYSMSSDSSSYKKGEKEAKDIFELRTELKSKGVSSETIIDIYKKNISSYVLTDWLGGQDYLKKL
jgi:hypothetical protein